MYAGSSPYSEGGVVGLMRRWASVLCRLAIIVSSTGTSLLPSPSPDLEGIESAWVARVVLNHRRRDWFVRSFARFAISSLKKSHSWIHLRIRFRIHHPTSERVVWYDLNYPVPCSFWNDGGLGRAYGAITSIMRTMRMGST